MTELKIYGDHDERTVSQMWRCMGVGSVAGGVLCADGHLGYAQPVGGVVAYEDHVSISGVGFDIGCGNMAARINLKYEDIKARVPVIANDINKAISFGMGRTNPKPIDHAVFDSPLWEDARHRPSQADGARPARHRRFRQPLRRPVRRRRRATCGSACTSARVASATRARRTTSSSPAARTAWTSRRRWCRSGASSASATSRR